jgi:hypothetical protein
MRKKLSIIAGIMAVMAVGANAALIQHLTATNGVTTSGTGVTAWADQTGNTDLTITRTATYPGDTFNSGLDGVQTPATTNSFGLLQTATAQNSIMAGQSFTMSVAFHTGDVIAAGLVRSVVVGNHGAPSAANLGIRIQFEGGKNHVIIGGSSTQKLYGGDVATDSSYVVSVRYDGTTGLLELWDNVNGLSSVNVGASYDFSSTQAMRLGGTDNGTQGFVGSVGEFKLYNEKLGDLAWAADNTLLENTWVVVPEPATIGMLGLGAIATLMIRRFKQRA